MATSVKYSGWKRTPGQTYISAFNLGIESLRLVGRDLQPLGDITITDGKNIIVNTTTGTKIGTATDQKIGFWNATPVVQPSAYTQTYATADKTHAADGSTDVATADLVDDGGTYNAGWCDTVVTMCNEIKADFNLLRATLTDLKQLANSIVDDLQILGLAA